METMHITENRYSGIPTICLEMKNAGLPAPKFEVIRGNFTVTLYNSATEIDEADKERSILEFCSVPRSRIEIANFLGISSTSYAISKYIKPLMETGNIDIENKQRPNEFHHIYGANKITAELKNRGFNASKNTILKIMQEEHIHSLRMDKNYCAFLNGEKRNVINRKFDTQRPNQAWVSDVTYLQIGNAKPKYFFLCVIMDLYSRKIIAHSVGETNSKRLINTTFRKAIESRDINEGLVFHSDRGANYTSKSFCDLLVEYGVIQSFSKPGTPYDNAVIESFFQNFKTECFNHYFDIRNKKELINIIDEYINFYNIKRSHSYLNYVSPDDYERKYFEHSKNPRTE